MSGQSSPTQREIYPREYVVASAPDKAGVLATFAKALDFPDYFGSNLDALVDCLFDFLLDLQHSSLVVWRLDARFKSSDDFSPVLQVLREATAQVQEYVERQTTVNRTVSRDLHLTEFDDEIWLAVTL